MSAIAEPAGRKLWVLARQLGLSDEERHSFTEVFLHKDDPSWSRLSDVEVRRLLDGLEGFVFVATLYRQRGPKR